MKAKLNAKTRMLSFTFKDEDFIIDDFIGLSTIKFQEIDGVKADASPDEYHP